ncbi:hypothetical protein A8B78_04800 [Jannaschia sp. EhC01]|nr:hypothetical protein A8B78_04800 [Jannaschia sp. EhC01]
MVHAGYWRLVEKGHAEDLNDVTDEELQNEISALFAELNSYVASKYPDNYLASLFKNQTKCREIASALQGE